MAPIHPDRARILNNAPTWGRGGKNCGRDTDRGSSSDQESTYNGRTRGTRGSRQESRLRAERGFEGRGTFMDRASEGGRRRKEDYERGVNRGFERSKERSHEGGGQKTGSKRKRPGRMARVKEAKARSRQNKERDNEEEQETRSSKKAKHHQIDVEEANSRPSSFNDRPSHGPATTSLQEAPLSQLSRSQRRNLYKEKTYERAANYPKLWDTEAWRELAKEPNQRIRSEHAFIYGYLRTEEGPNEYKMKEWKIKVHQEMKELGLEEVWTGNAKEDAVEIVEKQKEEPAGEDFDIDIYGDEETRAKYEPWIKSLTVNT